ncbi:Galactose oxidase [Pyrenophora seminiperda CCB06]|uniref:Galactose oxidase n=1 Tax=Pyrenophora seminiperda CCB06 TaxID=1302712 RepID=A0A3M7M9A2_9PLEO|nr:Galactose oxidase [Pyrenophora seminiperda CCB06]
MKYLNFIPFIMIGVAAAAVPMFEDKCFRNNLTATAPMPYPNSLDGFKHSKLYQELGMNARKLPGYRTVAYNAKCGFVSRNNEPAMLSSYDPAGCASMCDSCNWCESFNISIQREPSADVTYDCHDPEAVAITKCILYSLPLTRQDCTYFYTNHGPSDNDFISVVRASNGT